MLRVNNLIGFGAGGPKTVDFTFVTSTTGNNVNKAIPSAGVVAGDLCVIFDSGLKTTGSVSAVTPSGFTFVGGDTATDGSNNLGCRISAKILESGDIGGTVTGINGPDDSRYITAVFHPSTTIRGFTVNSPNNDGTSGNPAAQTITASGETKRAVLMLGSMRATGAVSPRTATSMTEIAGSATTHYAHYRIFNVGDATADQTYDMDDEGVNILLSAYLTFTV